MKVEPASNELAKVLWYYNLIYDTVTHDQKIVCPFHDDVNPSMIANLDRNAWYCFGCQESGDALKFTLMMESKYNGLNDLQGLAKYRRILKSRKCSNIKAPGRVKKKSELEPYTMKHMIITMGLSVQTGTVQNVMRNWKYTNICMPGDSRHRRLTSLMQG